MAEGRSDSRRVLQERSSSSPEGGGGWLWVWVIFSSLVHAVFIWGLFFLPHVPSSRARSYPIYTVDLVGGEKVGEVTRGSVLAPARAPKKKVKKLRPNPPPRVKKQKRKEKKKVVKSSARVREQALKKPEKRKVKKEPQAKKALSSQVREKLIQAALDRIKDRTKTREKKQKASEVNPGSGEDEGAVTVGKGGRGGGIIKGVEFLIYRNRMLYLIRERWTWMGKRSDLEVTVRFGIQGSGDIVGLKILQASGDPSFDDSVFRAVRKASPLPPPPESYRKDFMDVELTFRPKDLAG